jgi:hypothetical protein
MAEERRKPDDKYAELLGKVLMLEAAVDRLTEHEKADKPRYEEWHQDDVRRIVDLEQTRGELGVTAKHDLEAARREAEIRERVDKIVNGKLTSLDDRQRKMERTLWIAGGATTVITSLVVIIVNVVVKHL